MHGWWRWRERPSANDPWHWSGKSRSYPHEFFDGVVELGTPPAERDRRADFAWGMEPLETAWQT
jgi:hypothetical protein